MTTSIRFGRRRRDNFRADPALLKNYTNFNERIASIDKKFNEIMMELSRASAELENMGLVNDSTKIMYEKTKLWDIKNNITNTANGEPLRIIRKNLGMYDVSTEGSYR